MKAWIDGRMVDAEGAQAPMLSHALHYGTGVFEGIRSYGGAIFKLDAHMARFQRGADALGMKIDREAVAQACRRVIFENDLGDAYIRPLAFYALGSLQLDVAPLSVHQAVFALRWNSHLGTQAAQEGIRVKVSTIRRNPLPLKVTGAYANSVMAKLEAARSGLDEALFVDDRGRVCECTGENVFYVRRGEMIAVHHPDALPGITRETVMRLAKCGERETTLEELLDADEIFVTGTSAEVTPVCELAGRRFEIGSATRRMQELYRRLVQP